MSRTTKAQASIARNAGLVAARPRRRRTLLRVWKSKGITRREARMLFHDGLVESADSPRLTDVGRWAAIACMLDMSMVDLFIVADMYAAHCMWKERGVAGVYPLEWIEPKLELFLEPKTVRNRIWNLRRLGMVDKVSAGLYTITHMGANRLSPYHKDMYAMRAHVRRRL